LEIQKNIHVSFLDNFHAIGIGWKTKDGKRQAYGPIVLPEDVAEALSEVAHGRA